MWHPHPVPSLGAPLAALAALTVAGCGADSEPTATTAALPAEHQVRAVVARFGIASARKDYAQLCDELLARELVRSVEQIGLPCRDALRRGLADVEQPRLRILAVRVNGDRAAADVRSRAAGQPVSQDTIGLVREDGGWRIASLGGASAAPPSTTPTLPTTTVRPQTTATSTTRTETARTRTARARP